ncbi:MULTISPECIES: hypothetical protein [Burkholderia cepacia complex]|uniref:hypothetical protein n=1 Tax=Burkholderia cepacia complex TaxID=87882 RepID=UPI0011785243|nr:MULTISPECIES: hypothetical protein [Burkholderia cepacia complex]MBJ9963671.1 hypothetical protein [Burkholderia seminalis]
MLSHDTPVSPNGSGGALYGAKNGAKTYPERYATDTFRDTGDDWIGIAAVQNEKPRSTAGLE